MFKSRFDSHCMERNSLFDVAIDYTNVYALSVVVMNECCSYTLLILYIVIVPIKVAVEYGGTYSFIKGEQNSNQIKVSRRSGDNTETYQRE